MRSTLSASVRSCALMLVSTSAYAQDVGDVASADAPGPQQVKAASENTGLADIIVTARRREENLQVVPTAVTALGDEALSDRSVADVRAVAAFVPNAVGASGPVGAGSEASFFVRGIGQEDNSTTRDPGVGIYLDGVYLGRAQGAALDAFDIERIEVLRGPQGTLFGRNTIGGAVNITTHRPDDDLEAKAQVTLGSRERLDAKAYVAAPLVPGRLAASLAGTVRQQDGWVRQEFTGERLGDVDLKGVRGKIAWTPAGSLDVVLAADYTRFEGTARGLTSGGSSRPGEPGSLSPFGIPLPATINNFACSDVCFTTGASFDPQISSETWGAAATAALELGALELKSITSYRELKSVDNQDFDGTPLVFYTYHNEVDQEQFSQEIQLSGSVIGDHLDWLVGGYYFRERVGQISDQDFGGEDNGALPLSQRPLNPRSIGALLQPSSRNESIAGFAQGTARITQSFSVTAGARITREKKRISYANFIDNRAGGGELSIVPFFQTLPRALLPIPIAPREASFNPFNWRLGAEYRASDDLFLYGSVATGFRSGGFGNRATSDAEAEPFNPEKTVGYELGFKSELLKRAVRLNAAVFYTDYTDIQLLVPRGGFLVIQNAAAAEIKGAELEIETAPLSGFRGFISAGYQDSQYKQDVLVSNAGDILRKGDPLVQSPKWSLSTGLEKTIQLGGAGSVKLRGDYLYRSKISYIVDGSGLSPFSSYNVVNARVSWMSDDERWHIAVFGTNIFDDKYFTFATDARSSFGVYQKTPAPRSEFGAEMILRF